MTNKGRGLLVQLYCEYKSLSANNVTSLLVRYLLSLMQASTIGMVDMLPANFCMHALSLYVHLLMPQSQTKARFKTLCFQET